MKLKIAIQMDPIESINPGSDSTLLLGLEAQRRGHEVWLYTPRDLSLKNGKVMARAHRVRLYANAKKHFVRGKEAVLDLEKIDVVLLRQDPPFNMEYLATTYLLERLHPHPLVVNHPTAVRDHPEKLLPMLFPQFVPPTLVTSDVRDIAAFRKEYKDIVIKPLYGFGGHSVFRIKPGDGNFNALVETLFEENKDPWVVQPFLKEVKNQERRIVLIDGEFAGVVGRIPQGGDIRSNFRAGGKAAKVSLSKRQKEACTAIGPVLRQEGLLLAGVDMIGDYLTEINITSPTGLAAINRLYKTKLEKQFWDAVENYL